VSLCFYLRGAASFRGPVLVREHRLDCGYLLHYQQVACTHTVQQGVLLGWACCNPHCCHDTTLRRAP